MSQNPHDDDDLDDLDDVLDQFSSPAKPTSPQPTSLDGNVDETMMEEFAKEMAKEMESVFNGLTTQPAERPVEATERDRLAAAWEAMLVEEMNSMAGPSGARAFADDPPSGSDFRSRIRSTMDKRKEAESNLKSSESTAHGSDESFQSLLSQFQGLGSLSGDGTENEEEIQGVLEAMMGQLMSKDILYEPLKELHEKFPDYLAENASTLSSKDKRRFATQISLIKQLLTVFESDAYSDKDEKSREEIVGLMGELQSHGSPPEEIMGPLPPGFSLGADGLPDLPDNSCPVN